MKRLSAFWTVLLFFLTTLISYGQSAVKPQRLTIAYEKTTNLVFPFAITSVDRGTLDVLVQKAKGAENVLQVKAGVREFEETNLSVITADGNLYSFILNYNSHPTLTLCLPPKEPGRPLVHFTHAAHNRFGLLSDAETISAKQPMLRKRDKKFDIILQMSGIYVRDNVLYFQLELTNDSHIAYKVEQLRFYIRDKKKPKRTATQETELKPIYLYGNASRINGRSSQTVVVALNKFTIPDKKEFVIEMMEHNGGRHLQLEEGNRTIMKSQLLR